jgi:Trk-type K+ transport system membrane component
MPMTRTEQAVHTLKTFFSDFYGIHLAYFSILPIIGAAVLYAIEHDRIQVRFIDTLFTSFSAMTAAGLSCVDLSKMNIGSRIVVFMLFELGSIVLMTIVPLSMRTHRLGKAIESKHKKGSLKNEEAKDVLQVNMLKYEAMKMLRNITLSYYFLFQIIPTIVLWIYFSVHQSAIDILATNGNENAFFYSLFHVGSSFNNAGFGLFSNNMIPLIEQEFVLLFLSILMIAGNTMYPIFLRQTIKILKRISKSEKTKASYAFLLANPRESFTHLFPELNTNILFWALTFINIFQWIIFLALDWSSGLFGSINPFQKIVAALFQSVTTRATGFNVIDLNLESNAMNLLQIVLMYVAAIPNVLTVRGSALVDEEDDVPALSPYFYQSSSVGSKVLKWFRNRDFLVRQVFVLFCLTLAILTAETGRFRSDKYFTIFQVIFEIVSAYGSVGLSFGYPNTVVSLAAQFSDFSKICMCFVLVLGRMRGLPTTLDSAYTLNVQITYTEKSQNHDLSVGQVVINSTHLNDLKMQEENGVIIRTHLDSEGQKRTLAIRRRLQQYR